MADDILFDLLHMEMIVSVFQPDSNDCKKSTMSKLEQIGFYTGYRLVERLTKDWPRFKDELDTMKFICKELWLWMYKKQIDNLRTNHQGVYVLQDNSFRFLTQLSQSKQYVESTCKSTGVSEIKSYKSLSQKLSEYLSNYKEEGSTSLDSYLAFSCGVIRGALSNLDIKCVVTAEVSSPPACKFQVQVQRI